MVDVCARELCGYVSCGTPPDRNDEITFSEDGAGTVVKRSLAIVVEWENAWVFSSKTVTSRSASTNSII